MAIIERFIIKWEITLLALEAEVVDLAQVRFYSHEYTSAQFRSAPRGRLRSRVNITQRHLGCYYFYSNLSLGEAD
jgi:hypothetical protein